MRKKLLTLAVILLSGVFLTGCTLFGGDDEPEADSGGDIENVVVVDDKADEEAEDEVEDTEEVEDVDEAEEESEEEAEDEESVDDEEEESEVLEGAKTVGTATAAEGAAVHGYQYAVEGGKLNFEWKVAGNGDTYPKVAAQQGSDNALVVLFPSLQADYVAKEEGTTDLGNMLPEVMWKPTSEGSEYRFMYESSKTFELKTEDRGDEGQYVILVVSM